MRVFGITAYAYKDGRRDKDTLHLIIIADTVEAAKIQFEKNHIHRDYECKVQEIKLESGEYNLDQDEKTVSRKHYKWFIRNTENIEVLN